MIDEHSPSWSKRTSVGPCDRDRRRLPTPSPASSSASPATARLAVIDVETTGLNPLRERIVEIAIVRTDEHGRRLDHWTTRVNPDVPVRATHVHGITDADVAVAPRFADLTATIAAAVQDLVVVAHNAEFDLAFRRAEFARAGSPMPHMATYCTLHGELYLPRLRRRTLGACCAALGVPHRGAHSALGDASATAGLLAQYLDLDARTGADAPLAATRALHGGAPPAQAAPAAPPAPDRLCQVPSQNPPKSAQNLTTEQGSPAPGAADPTGAHPAPLRITGEFREALDHLHAGDHLFLTGKAGTGKSTLIRRYLESTERSTITVAPTGIAALNVDGYTIRRLFSFPIGVSEEMVRGGNNYPDRFRPHSRKGHAVSLNLSRCS